MLTRTKQEEEEDDDDEKEGGEKPGGARARKTRYGEGEQNACDARKGSRRWRGLVEVRFGRRWRQAPRSVPCA